MENQNLQFTRKELYELVWKNPISRISKSLNIKDSLIRRKCKVNNIPTPDSGYWAKLKFGKEVKKIPLPDIGKDKIISFTKDKKKISNKNLTNSLQAIKTKTKTPAKLVKPHPLINKAESKFLMNTRKYGSHKGLYGTDIDNLSIQVAPNSIKRALRIFDTVIKALEKREYPVKVENGKTIAIIENVNVPIRLREKTKRVIKAEYKYDWDKYEYKPTGLFVFVVELYAFRRKEIFENSIRLENKIDEIIEEIIRQGIKEKNDQIKWQKHREKEQQQRDIEAAKIKAVNEELEKFKSIFASQERWYKAQIMRQYLDKYEEHFSKKGQLNEEKIEWLVWARKKADWYDPFIKKEDELLDYIDINKLEPLQISRYW